MLHPPRLIAKNHKLALWWVVAVIFAASLAPAITHTFFGQSVRLAGVEICTSTGLQWVADAQAAPTQTADKAAGPLASAFSFEHCPFCLHQVGHGVLPPYPFAYLFLDAGGAQVPLAWQAFFYVKDSRFWAPPRGPPALPLQG